MYSIEKLIGLGVVGAFAFAAYKAVKTDLVLGKLDIAVNQLSDNVVVDVKEKLVEEAVNRAVDKTVAKEVSKAYASAISHRTHEIDSQVSDAVKACLGDIASEVKEEAMRQARNVDISKIRKEVTEELRETVVEKLKDDMEVILEDYKSHLRNIDSVYESIAEALSGREKKETFVRLI